MSEQKIKSEMVSTIMRRFRKHFPGTAWEEVESYFNFYQKEKLFCEYCGVQLVDTAPFPYTNLVSLDHKHSKFNGGKNAFDNVAITCCRCNIVKGTMNSDTYVKFLTVLKSKPDWKEEILNGLFWGKRANMLNRHNEKEKKPDKFLHEYM